MTGAPIPSSAPPARRAGPVRKMDVTAFQEFQHHRRHFLQLRTEFFNATTRFSSRRAGSSALTCIGFGRQGVQRRQSQLGKLSTGTGRAADSIGLKYISRPFGRCHPSERILLAVLRLRRLPHSESFAESVFRSARHFASRIREADWERDHWTAAQMGVNIFRHWFVGVDERARRYTERLRYMLELEGQNGIKTGIAEIVVGAPVMGQYPTARSTPTAQGRRLPSVPGAAAAPVPDNDDVRDAVGKFLDGAGGTVSRQARTLATTCGTSHVTECTAKAPSQVPRMAEGQIRHYQRSAARGIATVTPTGNPSIRRAAPAATPIPSTGWNSAATTRFAFCAGAPL